jgi:hypothetical protein
MYDTVAALWRHPGAEVVELIPWRERRERVLPDGVRVTAMAGEHGGVQVLLHPDGSVKVERSLPKALTGQNAVDLQQEDVPVALAAVDRELVDLAPEVEFPAVGSLDPCRVDYCRSVSMGSPAEVDVVLRRLASVQLPRKGRPVVGESGSVSWPLGEFRPKFYSKGRETGNLVYLNVLRYEVGAFGSRALGHIPGLVGPGSDGRLTVRDVLVPQAAGFVLGRFLDRVGGFDMTFEDVSDLAMLRELVAFFGPRRAFGLVGLCVGWSSMGVRTWQELEALELGDQAQWYRARADLRRFRDALAVKWGRDAGSVDDVQGRLAGIARFMAA